MSASVAEQALLIVAQTLPLHKDTVIVKIRLNALCRRFREHTWRPPTMMTPENYWYWTFRIDTERHIARRHVRRTGRYPGFIEIIVPLMEV